MSEGIDALMDAEGFAGYGRWVRLLEIIALKMDETTRCHAEYSMQKWCRLLRLKQKKLISFLELTENQLKTKVVYSENIIRIEIPNLLKKRDNYTKNLQVTSKPLISKEVEVEVEVEVEKKILKKVKKGIKKFTPPDIEEVKAYCSERQNNVDPNKWVNHYESNGWKVGKNKMKSWKAAVRTWESNSLNGGNGKSNNLKTTDYTKGVKADGSF